MKSRPKEVNPHLKLACWTLPVIAVSWLLIAVVDPDPSGLSLEEVFLGFFLGSMFGHATLAAAWTVLGPGPLTLRLAGSLLWVFLLPVAGGININLNGGPPLNAAVLIGACLFGQWVLLQFLLWPLAIGYGLHLRHASSQGADLDRRHRQFGIAQLIIVTAIVGVFLGIGRAILSMLGDRLDLRDQEAPIFIFLAIAAVLLTLPLVLASLLKQHATKGVLLTLSVIGLFTALEMRLLQAVHSGAGPNLGHFVGINVFMCLWILAMLGLVRRCGFRLGTSRQQTV